MGSILNPINIVLEIQKLLHPPVKDILSGFEGVVKPGEMLREPIYAIPVHPLIALHQLSWEDPGPDPRHY
jgi:hypothetical protein